MNFIETIHANFARGDAPALTEMLATQARPLSWRALGSLVAQARAELREKGVKPGDRVALIAANGQRWVAADLAILMEGAIAVPLYNRQSAHELVAMLKDCEPSLVVGEAGLEAELRALWSEIPWAELASLFGAKALDEKPCPRAASDIVTLVYTSGTSGVAKGVMLSCANVDFMLARTRDALRRVLDLPEMSHRLFHYLPFCFAGSRMVLWTSLLRGGELHLSTDLQALAAEMGAAEPHYFLNVPALLERIRKGVEEKLQARPRAIQMLYRRGTALYAKSLRAKLSLPEQVLLKAAETLVFRQIAKRLGPQLRCLICGSAPLMEETQQWFHMLGIPVYQVYGLTETTAIITLDEPGQARVGYVGKVIAGCEARIDAQGELQVRGPNVFAGYFRRPEESEAVLGKEGWFRTGDQAEMDEAGHLKILGRVNHILVPTSGHNVAPEPIEETLRTRIPGAEHVVVFGHARPYLVALITGNVERSQAQAQIDAYNQELPHYRRIRAFTLSPQGLNAEQGLLTANQKLRRKAIAAHYAAQIDALYRENAGAKPNPALTSPQRPSEGGLPA